MFDLLSPIRHAGAASPPTLLFHGEHDFIVPVASSRRLCRVLIEAGVQAVYVEYPRAEHAFDILYPPLMNPAGQAALHDLERWLACVASQADARAGQAPGRREARAGAPERP